METKSVFTAIIGRPNVGKSSLLNRLVGEKVAIVSDKPQTTRNRITGVLTKGVTQFVFIDTPGLHKAKSKLGKYMVKQISESVADVDVAVLVTECMGPITTAEKMLVENLATSEMPAILVLNKTDLLVEKDEMLPKIAEFASLHEFDAILPISTLDGEGIDRLMGLLEGYGSESPHFFPEDAMTDQPERAVVAEIVREKILRNMRDEIPHGTAVVVEKMREREDAPIIDIDVNIYCEKDSHKGMLIGKQGAMLKKIATEARQECESFLDIKINMQCWVKVKEDWRDNDSLLKNFGYSK